MIIDATKQLYRHIIEEIQQRLSISQLVSEHVPLKRAGRLYKGLCPFHQEKSPSFTVTDERRTFHCFGCGAHGDVVRFLMRIDGISFKEAVETLARRVGVSLPRFSAEEIQKEERRELYFQTLELACQFYELQLTKTIGSRARDYLSGRGLSQATITQFRLGYAPETGNGLKDYLTKHGVDEEVQVVSGAVGRNEKGRFYDRFFGRVIFPIQDSGGRVIGFGGRSLGDAMPKYLNSAESEVFLKKETLYALSHARKSIFHEETMLVCEGYLDVIACHQAGITSAVAPLGTAINEHLISILWRYAKEPVICFDGDEAGKKAMVRIADLALPQLKLGVSLKFCMLPAQMDPDDIIRYQGSDALKDYIAHAKPLSEVIWEHELAAHPRKTPEQQALFKNFVFKRVQTISDPELRKFYQQYFNQKLYALQSFGSGKKIQPTGHVVSSLAITRQSKLDVMLPAVRIELALIRCLLLYPSLLTNEVIHDELFNLYWQDDAAGRVMHQLLLWGQLRTSEQLKALSADDLDVLLQSETWYDEVAKIHKRAVHVLDMGIATSEVWEQVVLSVLLLLKRHTLVRLESDYQQLLSTPDDAGFNRALALKVEIDHLRKTITQMSFQ